MAELPRLEPSAVDEAVLAIAEATRRGEVEWHRLLGPHWLGLFPADGRRDRFVRLVRTESGGGILTTFARSGEPTGEMDTSNGAATRAFAELTAAIGAAATASEGSDG